MKPRGSLADKMTQVCSELQSRVRECLNGIGSVKTEGEKILLISVGIAAFCIADGCFCCEVCVLKHRQ